LNRIHTFVLSLYFFSIHFELWDPLNTGIDYLNTKITISLYIMISLIRFSGFKSIREYNKFTIPLILLFVIGNVSGYFNQHPGYEDYFVLTEFLNILIFILMLLHHKKDNHAIIKGLNGFIYGAIVLLIFFLLDIGTDNSLDGRYTMFGTNQNQLSVDIAVVSLLILSKLIYKKDISNSLKLFFLIILPFLVLFLVSTGSRTGVISFFIGCSLMIFLKKSNFFYAKISKLILGILTSSLLYKYFMSDSIFGERLTDSIENFDLSGRDIYWDMILNFFDFNLIFGIGINGYKYQSDLIFGTFVSTHNIFIQNLITGGIVSVIILIFYFFMITKKSFIIYKNSSNPLFLILLVPIIFLALTGQVFGSKITFGIFALIIIHSIQFKKIDNL